MTSTAPLQIGTITIDPPVVLAPMAGVTNPAYRALCRSYGAPLCTTEMITARAVVERHPHTLRMVRRPTEAPVHSVQLYGVDPAVVGLAVRHLVEEAGADHVDLNFGCPAAKVTRKGGGAALPVRHVLFGRIVAEAVRAGGHVPVTVKMRMGVDDDHRTDRRAARIAEEEGAAAVALHARTAEQLYAGPARWSAIAELAASVRSIPVLGNGDLWEAGDALAMIARTGCDGVVIGRGCLGRPWLFRDLVAAFAGRPVPPPPPLAEVVLVMRRHVEMLCDDSGEHAGVRDFRKHVGWYLAGFPVGRERRRRLTSATTLDELLAALDDVLDGLDPASTLPPELVRAPRGHTNGPRRVRMPDGWLVDVDDPRPPRGADALVSGG